MTNTSEVGVWFNVQTEWARERLKPMTDEEAHVFAMPLWTGRETTETSDFDVPDWVGLEDDGRDVFDLANGGTPLRFHLDPNGAHHVQVTFRPSPEKVWPDILTDDDRPVSETTERVGPAVVDRSGSVVFQRRVYAAKFNVHVDHIVLHRFHVLGFVDMAPT